MASLGLPGLAGFWGEMLAIRAAVDQAAALPEVTYRWLAFIAALGVILTSAYFLAVMRGMLQGPTADAAGAPDTAAASPLADLPSTGSTVTVLATDRVEAERLLHDRPDVGRVEWVTWGPLIVLTVVLGVAPGLLLTPVAEAASTFLGGLR
jgi:NADH-quinone oxidoreductase subunit M